MKDLKFTIITPSFNQGKYIEETICSIITQKYEHFEYFIIDGGSSDDTLSIIKKYEQEIDFYISEKDRGQSDAINKGLERATGDVLIWINSDDVMAENTLTRVAAYFNENQSVDVVHGQTIVFQAEKQFTKGADAKNLPEQYLSGMAFPQPSAFIRRSALLRFFPALDTSLHFGMDFDLFSCLYLNGEFLHVSDIFSKYRLHEASKTVTTNEKFAVDWQRVFCKIVESIGGLHDIRDSLVTLHMWHDVSVRYSVSKSFEKKFLVKSFQYFLEFQINFYYRELNLARVRSIGAFLKNTFPYFYKERNIHRLYLVSLFPLAKYLIPLMRKSIF